MTKNSGCLAFTKRSTEIIHLRHSQYVFIIEIQIFAPPDKKVATKFQFSFFHRSEKSGLKSGTKWIKVWTRKLDDFRQFRSILTQRYLFSGEGLSKVKRLDSCSRASVGLSFCFSSSFRNLNWFSLLDAIILSDPMFATYV